MKEKFHHPARRLALAPMPHFRMTAAVDDNCLMSQNCSFEVWVHLRRLVGKAQQDEIGHSRSGDRGCSSPQTVIQHTSKAQVHGQRDLEAVSHLELVQRQACWLQSLHAGGHSR